MEKDNVITELIALIHDVGRSMRQGFLRRKSTCGANILQWHALSLLVEHSGMTMKEFADAMFITPPSATTFADRLTKLRWTERRVDPKNRKLVHLFVTPAGRRIFERERAKMSTVVRQSLRHCPLADQRHLLRILKRFHENLHVSLTQQS
ncbi:MAG: MarR family transcriptional regulator [Candidatus Peribacteraceae bacterium]|nr:MarR family transcriptional regulator [Candidatus Peribacteraceae bacterium]